MPLLSLSLVVYGLLKTVVQKPRMFHAEGLFAFCAKHAGTLLWSMIYSLASRQPISACASCSLQHFSQTQN